jgi:hypothetical protein
MSTKRDVVVADFNRSVIPTIVCVNKAKTPLGVKFDDLIPALQEFLDRCFVPVWGDSGEIGQRQKNAAEALEHDFLGRRGFAWRRRLSRHYVARHAARQSLRQADARRQGSRQRHRLS